MHQNVALCGNGLKPGMETDFLKDMGKGVDAGSSSSLPMMILPYQIHVYDSKPEFVFCKCLRLDQSEMSHLLRKWNERNYGNGTRNGSYILFISFFSLT